MTVLNDLNMSFKSSAATQTIGMSIEDIVASLKSSAEFFIQFFLGDELTHNVPPFHVETWEYLTRLDVPKLALALPRAHAKTTLAKLAVVWYFLFTNVRFVVYVSDTGSMAASACRDIVNYMRSANFEAVFGPISFEVQQEGHGFYKFTIQYIDEAGFLREKHCVLKAFGSGQQILAMNFDN